MKKRLLSLVLCLVMVFSLVPFSASAEGYKPTPETPTNGATITNPNTAYTTRRDLVLDKTLTANNDGTFDLKLVSYATGKVTTKVVTHQVPTDFILVVDQSGSMAYTDMPTKYKPATMPNGGWTFDNFVGTNGTDDAEYYFKDENTGDYYRVYRKWGDLFELVPRQSMYINQVVDRRGLSWGQSESEEEQDFTSQYYYRPATDPLIATLDPTAAGDTNFYPLTITAQGGWLTYFIKFKYTDAGGTQRTVKFYNGTPESTNTAYYTAGTATREGSNALLYRNGLTGDFVPGGSFLFSYSAISNAVVYHSEHNDLGGAARVLLGNTAQTQKPRDRYTFANISSLTTGMYVQNPLFIRHVGYNALAYRDANGVEHIISSTDYCNSQGEPTRDDHGTTAYTDTTLKLYVADGTKKSRVDAVKEALNAFVDNVAKQTDDEGAVNHRVAIVGFAGDSSVNNELLTNQNWTPNGTTGIPKTGSTGADRNTSYYTNALVTARADDADGINDALTSGINALTANGGTQPEIGLQMAYNILNNNKTSAQYNQTDSDGKVIRNAVVIFFTDGRPGDYATDNQYTEANQVVAQANDIKTKIPGAQLYSVGVFGEADGNPLTYHQDITNWLGFTTTTNFLEKDRLLEDFSTANGREKDGYGDVNPGLNNYSDYVTDYAENTYYPDFYKEDGTITNTNFTFRWREGLSLGYNRSWTGTGKVHRISGTYWRDAIRNTAGYPAQQNDTIADYMTVVSSTYPNATSFDGGWSTMGNTARSRTTYNAVVDGVRRNRVDKMYYSLSTDTNRLTEVFTNIAEDVSTSGSTVTLGSEAILKDIVNTEVFNMPASASSIQAKAVKATATDTAGNVTYNVQENTVLENLSSHVRQDASGNVTVDGFDYSTYYVMDGKDDGRALILEIKGLTLKDAVNGEVLSNNDAGIYATEQDQEHPGQVIISKDPTLAIDSPKLTIAGAVDPTYVIDFNAPMTVATGAEQVNQIERTNPNGSFTKVGKTAVYKLKTLGHPAAGSTTDLALSGVDSAMVYGVPAGSPDGTSVAWNKITAVPASSVYFDDDLNELTNAIAVGDGHGYANIQASDANALADDEIYSFTFNGSGIDVYCTTTSGTGYIMAKVDNAQVKTIKNQADHERYNTPTISYRGLDEGEHTLQIFVLEGAKYKLDGIRVYKPVAESNYTGEAANEANASYTNLRGLLVNDNATQFVTYPGNAAANGILYVDNKDKVSITQTMTNEDGTPKMENDKPVTQRVYATDYLGYKANSPKNEIYLENGQGVAFTVTGYSQLSETAKNNIYVGLSTPKNEEATVKYANTDDAPTQTVRSGVDMYYKITPAAISNDGSATFVVINDSAPVVSLTNLKISGNGTPVTVTAGNGAIVLSAAEEPQEAEAVELQLVVNESTLKVLANLQDETADPSDPGEPETPTQPEDPTPTPGIFDWLQQLFSAFVKNLFGSISRLFGN